MPLYTTASLSRMVSVCLRFSPVLSLSVCCLCLFVTRGLSLPVSLCTEANREGIAGTERGAAGGAAGRRRAGGLGGREADGRRRAALRADGSGTTLCVRARARARVRVGDSACGWVTLRVGSTSSRTTAWRCWCAAQTSSATLTGCSSGCLRTGSRCTGGSSAGLWFCATPRPATSSRRSADLSRQLRRELGVNSQQHPGRCRALNAGGAARFTRQCRRATSRRGMPPEAAARRCARRLWLALHASRNGRGACVTAAPCRLGARGPMHKRNSCVRPDAKSLLVAAPGLL